MSAAAILYYWLVPVGIVIGPVGIATRLLPGWPLLGRISRVVAWGYGLAVGAAWVLRYREAGHMPLFGTYESALSLALATMATAILWESVFGGRLPVSPVAALIAGALLGHGRGYDPTPYALTISERSWIVDIHAWVAWLAFGVLAVNLILALWVLLSKRPTLVDEGTAPANSGATGGGLVFSLQLGFLLHTAMLVSGSFYKFLLFGTAWSFDPIETLGFVAWMAYGTLLHMVLFAGWEGRRLARWCLGLFVVLVISYRGIVYFPAWSTYHIFDMDLRIHLMGGE